MSSSEEFKQKLRAFHEAQAQADVYLDVDKFLKKYEERLNRQYTQADRDYARLQKTYAPINAQNAALQKVIRTQHQQLAQRDFRIENLKRANDALKTVRTLEEELIALSAQIDNEEQ